MKNIRTLLFMFITTLCITSVHAANIDTVEVADTKNINLQLSQDITLGDTVEGEMKVLKDINITFASKDFNDASKVILTLNEDLKTGNNYSLLSIFGADGNIDFTTTDSLEDVEIMNEIVPTEQGIVKVIVKDTRTLEVVFFEALTEDEFEFKLLSELTVDAMTYNSAENKLQLSIAETFEKNFNYMIIVLSLKDIMGTEIVLDDDLYNFETSDTLEGVQEEELSIDALLSDDDLLNAEETTEEIENLEEVALNAAASPQTGTETGIVLLFTTLLTGFIFLRKKFQK
ncbi:hypothetical protein A9Q91_04975 [Candidatus Gracilibacteria bacterium 28_42_T64]|nr:hypothetical protein A9Q91_04975 [Candidatus Gracilibacteria bacterium 28_42_T64]